MNYSFERKGLHSTTTGTVDDMDALSLIRCISVLEVFPLNRKVVCYRHSLPLHDFDSLSCIQNFLSVGSVLSVRLKWGCGHSSGNVGKTVQDVAMHVPGEKERAFGVTCAKLFVARSTALKQPWDGLCPVVERGQRYSS